MEKDIKLGSVGDLDLKVEGGVASATLNANVSLLGGAINLSIPVKLSADLNGLLKAGFAFAESKSPAALQPVEQVVEGIAEQALDKL